VSTKKRNELLTELKDLMLGHGSSSLFCEMSSPLQSSEWYKGEKRRKLVCRSRIFVVSIVVLVPLHYCLLTWEDNQTMDAETIKTVM
jgi:hypothetical protein